MSRSDLLVINCLHCEYAQFNNRLLWFFCGFRGSDDSLYCNFVASFDNNVFPRSQVYVCAIFPCVHSHYGGMGWIRFDVVVNSRMVTYVTVCDQMTTVFRFSKMFALLDTIFACTRTPVDQDLKIVPDRGTGQGSTRRCAKMCQRNIEEWLRIYIHSFHLRTFAKCRRHLGVIVLACIRLSLSPLQLVLSANCALRRTLGVVGGICPHLTSL